MRFALILLLLTFSSALVQAQPRIFTICQTATNQIDSFEVADFEYVTILSARELWWRAPNQLTISNQSATFNLNINPVNATANKNLDGIVFKGPATVILNSGTNSSEPRAQPLFLTYELGPTAYPVTNSVNLGPGQGAEINLQSSTNLVEWTPATNGVYTAQQAMFFRLFLHRIQP